MQPRFVLTGGIGSGKTTAGEIFRELGAVVLSADEIGHTVLASDGEVFAAVAERWPQVIVDGAVDRAALATIVFADPSELAALESLTHPAIRRRLIEAVTVLDAADPVVVETPVPQVVDLDWPVVVVDTSEERRALRLRARGMDDDDIAARMARQPARGEWLALADLVVDNSDDIASLRSECQRVWSWLRDRSPSTGTHEPSEDGANPVR